MASGYYRISVSMSSQQLSMPAQEKASQQSSMEWGAVNPLVKELLTVDRLLKEGESVFFKGMAPGRSARLQGVAPQP